MPFDLTCDSINFTAEIRPLYDAIGNEIDPNIARGVYRKDTDQCISSCGPATHLIQHNEVLDPVFKGLEDLDYKIEERTANSSNLYDLQGNSGAWVSHQVADNGALMRSTIITGDFINPTGTSSYLGQGPDTNFFRIRVLNSHNSKSAVRVDFDYLRVLCMNGMTSPIFKVSMYGKHTANFQMTGMQERIEGAINNMHVDADRFGQYARTKLSYDQASTFLRATIAKKLPPKWERMGRKREVADKHDKIMNLFQWEDQTVWGLYNAMTSWQTHGQMMQNTNEITGRMTREATVSKALNTNEWKELIEA